MQGRVGGDQRSLQGRREARQAEMPGEVSGIDFWRPCFCLTTSF